jgi:hypothetical protein
MFRIPVVLSAFYPERRVAGAVVLTQEEHATYCKADGVASKCIHALLESRYR